MSGVAGLYNVASTPDEFWTWSFIHTAHHRDINRVVYQLVGTVLDEFVLDPFDAEDAEGWLRNHQQMHQQMDEALGIAGYNLLAVDFNDQNQFASWVFLNADEHFKAANILGIG